MSKIKTAQASRLASGRLFPSTDKRSDASKNLDADMVNGYNTTSAGVAELADAADLKH